MARTSTTKLSARDRARAAKARLDADQHDHQKLVEDGVIAYYEAEDAVEAATEAMTVAEVARAAAVSTLLELNESVSRIASLTGLDASEVRKLRRMASSSEKNDDTGDGSPEGASAVTADPDAGSTTPGS